MTGRATSFVSKEILDGFWSIVVSGVVIHWLPFVPPLPLTVTLLSLAVFPKLLIPVNELGTLNAMPEMGISPLVVLAVTLAVPANVISAADVSVTCWNSVCIAPSLIAGKGKLWNVIGREARLPVDTPPTVSEVGRVNCCYREFFN